VQFGAGKDSAECVARCLGNVIYQRCVCGVRHRIAVGAVRYRDTDAVVTRRETGTAEDLLPPLLHCDEARHSKMR
jgi:hypothetical protein